MGFSRPRTVIYKSIFLTSTFGPLNFPPWNGPNRVFRTDPVFEYSGPRRSAKTGANRLDWMRCAFFRIYSGFLLKFQHGKSTSMDFSQNFQMHRSVFVILNWFYAVFWNQGCFHWLSIPIRQELWLIQGLPATVVACAGVERNLATSVPSKEISNQCYLESVHLRKCILPPDHLRSEISFSRTCNLPHLKVKNH